MVLPAGPNTPNTETERAPRPLKEILPPYLVILHNDDHHSMDFVIAALLKSVSSLTTVGATSIMLEAHDKGKAVVITCPLEQAEFYRDRLRTFGLGVTIERA